MKPKYETNLLQNWEEFQEFLRLIKDNKVKSYLELGSKNGGSFWRVTNTLPRGSRVVSVDLPHGDLSFKVTKPNLEACVKELKNRLYDVHLLIGDSTDPEVVEKVRGLGPFDLCLIDANHTEPYVRKDWANYGPMCRMVAFHDISHVNDDPKKMPIDAPKVWNELKDNYKHKEIRLEKRHNGIGVLWR